MHHVAIMKKSWKLIPKVLSGEKTIESRWYQTRRAPWNTVKEGDTIYFKNGGEPVIAKAQVSSVLQFEINSASDCKKIVEKYGKQIGLLNLNPKTWGKLPKYCILVRLTSQEKVKPFEINKTGFGNACAWMAVPHISHIKQK